MCCPAQAASGQYGSLPTTNGALLKATAAVIDCLRHAPGHAGHLESFGVEGTIVELGTAFVPHFVLA